MGFALLFNSVVYSFSSFLRVMTILTPDNTVIPTTVVSTMAINTTVYRSLLPLSRGHRNSPNTMKTSRVHTSLSRLVRLVIRSE